jgi:integrase
MEIRNIKAFNTSEKYIDSMLNNQEMLPEQREVLKEYDRYSKSKGLKVNSRKSYVVLLKHFSIHVKKPYKDMTEKDIINYFSSIKVSPNTFTLAQITLKAFFRWFYKSDNPEVISWIKIKRADNGLPKIVPLIDIKKLVNACDNPRDKCLVMVLWDSSCRASEIGTLNIGDITFDEFGAKILVNGKTGERSVRLIDSVPDLKLWLSCHPYKDDINKPLFISLANLNYGERLEGTGIYQTIAKLRKRAKIERALTPHTIRRTRITELAKNGFAEAELRLIAGWVRGSQTPKHYIALTGEDVDRKLLEKKGLLTIEEGEKEKVLDSKKCMFCGESNSPSSRLCLSCNMPLHLSSTSHLYQVLVSAN